MGRLGPGVAGVLFWLSGFAACALAGDDREQQRLISLLEGVQDIFVAINRGILQYGARLDDTARRMQDRALWAEPPLDESKLAPIVRELGRLKATVSRTDRRLESTFDQLRSLQDECQDLYPGQMWEFVDRFSMVDELYHDSRGRCRDILLDIQDLQAWFDRRLAHARQGTRLR
jgi:hypothetical protein